MAAMATSDKERMHERSSRDQIIQTCSNAVCEMMAMFDAP